MSHKYGEAYHLMLYANADATEREVLWNSRDGVTPFCIASATTGNEMQHVDWSGSTYAPNHVPKVGERIFVDMTETRARVLAERRVERWLERERSGAMNGLPRLEDMFDSREAAVQNAFEGFFQPGAPDILVVTAGWLEQLEEQRARQRRARALRPFEIESRLLTPDPVHYDPAPVAPDREPFAYDRNVQPIYDFRELGKLLEDREYKRVASTRVGRFHISTVWMGVDHNHERFFGGDQRPIIFETMVFGDGDTGSPLEELTERSHTEHEAKKRHEQIVGVVTELVRKQDEKPTN